MKTEKLIEQLELYSNAITGFVIVQSLGFAFTLGTNTAFACLAFSERFLNLGLAAHFAVSCIVACVALEFLSRSIGRLSSENQALLRKLFIGKMVAVVLFIVVPIAVLLVYGAGDTTLRACAAATR